MEKRVYTAIIVEVTILAVQLNKRFVCLFSKKAFDFGNETTSNLLLANA
jgi:hypothetical protein